MAPASDENPANSPKRMFAAGNYNSTPMPFNSLRKTPRKKRGSRRYLGAFAAMLRTAVNLRYTCGGELSPCSRLKSWLWCAKIPSAMQGKPRTGSWSPTGTDGVRGKHNCLTTPKDGGPRNRQGDETMGQLLVPCGMATRQKRRICRHVRRDDRRVYPASRPQRG